MTSRTEVQKWQWPPQPVTPACRCSLHAYAHVHPTGELWDAKPIQPQTENAPANENNQKEKFNDANYSLYTEQVV
jgi:hypothetical protein